MPSPNSVFDPVNVDSEGSAVYLGAEKPLLTIYQALNALTTAQKNAIWAAFVAGTPPKWAQDGADGQTWGKHAPALAAASTMAVDFPVGSGWTAALQTQARLKMVAIYLLDNPTWLNGNTFGGSVPAVTVLPYTPPS